MAFIDFNSSLPIDYPLIASSDAQLLTWDGGAVEYSTLTFASTTDQWSSDVDHIQHGELVWFQRDYYSFALMAMDIIRQIPMYMARDEVTKTISADLIQQVKVYSHRRLTNHQVPSMCHFMMTEALVDSHWVMNKRFNDANKVMRSEWYGDANNSKLIEILCGMTTLLWVPSLAAASSQQSSSSQPSAAASSSSSSSSSSSQQQFTATIHAARCTSLDALQTELESLIANSNR